MSFHVYLEPELQSKVDAFCKKTGQKRNSVIRDALRNYLDDKSELKWPPAVFDFKADPNLPRFESFRDEFPEERDDVFRRKK